MSQTDGTNTLSFIYSPGGTALGFKYNGTKYFYLRNVQGDIVSIYDSTGTVVVNYTYDSWGKLLSTTGSLATTIGVINPLRYRGYYYDTETGLYYLQSRYYDPETGRFINADGIMGINPDMATYNLFAYCGNNPVMYCDPCGNYYLFRSLGEEFLATATGDYSHVIVINPSKGNSDNISSSSTSAGKESDSTTVCGNALGAGEFVNTVMCSALKITNITPLNYLKYCGLTSKTFTTAGAAFVFMPAGIGVYNNINCGASPNKIIIDAAVDVAVGGGIYITSVTLGSALGTLICPGLGTAAGVAIGLLIGIGADYCINKMPYKGTTESAYWKKGLYDLC